MEDSESDSYVAVEEVRASDYTLEWIGDGTKIADKKIRVVLRSVTKPGTILPFKILDQNGTVLCATLGEAFFKKEESVVFAKWHCTYTTKWMYCYGLGMNFFSYISVLIELLNLINCWQYQTLWMRRCSHILFLYNWVSLKRSISWFVAIWSKYCIWDSTFHMFWSLCVFGCFVYSIFAMEPADLFYEHKWEANFVYGAIRTVRVEE
jgi:hypothetical protein